MAIDTVIFDIGNVLAGFDWAGFVRSFGFGPQVNERIARAVFQSEDWHQVDLGLKSDGELIDAFVANDPELEAEIREIFGRWQYSVTEYPFAEGWLRSLKDRGYRGYILSNYGRTMFNYARGHFRFLRHADGAVISYEINQIKPWPEIYRRLIEKYSIVPKNAVFLDDLPENLAGAREQGINTILVEDHDRAARELEELLGN